MKKKDCLKDGSTLPCLLQGVPKHKPRMNTHKLNFEISDQADLSSLHQQCAIKMWAVYLPLLVLRFHSLYIQKI